MKNYQLVVLAILFWLIPTALKELKDTLESVVLNHIYKSPWENYDFAVRAADWTGYLFMLLVALICFRFVKSKTNQRE